MNIGQATARYLFRKVPQNFPGWTMEALEDYIFHHIEQGTISICLDYENQVLGTLIGWRQKGSKQKKWEWQESDPKGNIWWWDQFACENHDVAIELARDFMSRNPDSAVIPGSGVRNGKVKRYKLGDVLKLWNKAKKRYGKHRRST